MRLIDAEKYPCKGCPIEYCYENCKKFYAWLEGCDYDVEAKVAELKANKNHYMQEYFKSYDDEDKGRYIAFDDAISIVRGKE